MHMSDAASHCLPVIGIDASQPQSMERPPPLIYLSIYHLARSLFMYPSIHTYLLSASYESGPALGAGDNSGG